MNSSSSKPPLTTGMWLLIIGIIHNLVGLIAGFYGLPEGDLSGRSPIAEIVDLGIFNSIDPDPLRALWFWFIWFGWAVMFAAWALHLFEKHTGTLPTQLLWMLAALGISGVFMMPASGFWFVVLLAAWKLKPTSRKILKVSKISKIKTKTII